MAVEAGWYVAYFATYIDRYIVYCGYIHSRANLSVDVNFLHDEISHSVPFPGPNAKSLIQQGFVVSRISLRLTNLFA